MLQLWQVISATFFRLPWPSRYLFFPWPLIWFTAWWTSALMLLITEMSVAFWFVTWLFSLCSCLLQHICFFQALPWTFDWLAGRGLALAYSIVTYSWIDCLSFSGWSQSCFIQVINNSSSSMFIGTGSGVWVDLGTGEGLDIWTATEHLAVLLLLIRGILVRWNRKGRMTSLAFQTDWLNCWLSF